MHFAGKIQLKQFVQRELLKMDKELGDKEIVNEIMILPMSAIRRKVSMILSTNELSLKDDMAKAIADVYRRHNIVVQED